MESLELPLKRKSCLEKLSINDKINFFFHLEIASKYCHKFIFKECIMTFLRSALVGLIIID